MARDVDGLKQFLGGIAVFGGLSEKALDRVIPMLIEQRFASGATVCKEARAGARCSWCEKGMWWSAARPSQAIWYGSPAWVPASSSVR